MNLLFKLLTLLLTIILVVVAGWFYLDRESDIRVTISAGGRGGEAFALAQAIAEVTERHYPNLRIEIMETGGSTKNMQLLDAGEVDLATIQADTRILPSAKLVAQLYPDLFQLLVRESSGIRQVSDLKNKLVALPSKTSGQYRSFWFLANHYGLTEEDIIALPMSSQSALFAMEDEAVDALFRVRAPGNKTIKKLVDRGKTRLIPIEQGVAMQLKLPAIKPGSIPIGAYQGEPPLPPNDLPTASVVRYLVAGESVAEDVVEAITRVLFEHRRELIVHTSLAGFIEAPDQLIGTLLPVHEGAKRFYDREKPSFLHENAEPIALILSVGALIGSALLGLHTRLLGNQKDRADKYNNRLVELSSFTRNCGDIGKLKEIRDELFEILEQANRELDEDRITREGFDTFSFIWGAARSAIRDRYTELVGGSKEASMSGGAA